MDPDAPEVVGVKVAAGKWARSPEMAVAWSAVEESYLPKKLKVIKPNFEAHPRPQVCID